MIRDFDKLAEGRFDLLVIGGGIYGAWTAFDAAQRGLRVALVERRDWASGTSSVSSKLIHGGLRYLEQYRFRLVRRAIGERERLLRLAPHAVRPLRFLMPVRRKGRVGKTRLGLGLWLYDRLAGERHAKYRRRFLDRDDLGTSHPFLETGGLRGAFAFYDSQMDDARLVLEIVDGAFAAGAVTVNRARALEILVRNGAASGAVVQDGETGRRVDVDAAMVANCAGPWAPVLSRETAEQSAPTRLSKGAHLVMPGLPSPDGLLLLSRSHGGVVFMIPWYGRTLVGTTDTEFDGDPDAVAPDPAEVSYLLEQANGTLAGAPWSEKDIAGGFAGLRTMPGASGGSTASVSRELAVDEPVPGLLCPIGGKYSSSRVDAAGIVDRICERIGRGAFGRPTDVEPTPWAPRETEKAWRSTTLLRGLDVGLDEETVAAWQWRYGARIGHLFDRLAEHPEFAARVVPDLPFREVELAHAVEHEMARGLVDVLRRRLPLLILTQPSHDALRRAAEVVGGLLDWPASRRDTEVAEATNAIWIPPAGGSRRESSGDDQSRANAR